MSEEKDLIDSFVDPEDEMEMEDGHFSKPHSKALIGLVVILFFFLTGMITGIFIGHLLW